MDKLDEGITYELCSHCGAIIDATSRLRGYKYLRYNYRAGMEKPKIELSVDKIVWVLSGEK